MSQLIARGRHWWASVGLRGSVPVALTALVFWMIMIGSSRERPWGDARPIYEVAQALVERQEVSIDTRWPPIIPQGRDKKLYAVSPLLPSLVHIPGATIRHFVIKWSASLSPAKQAAIAELSLPFAAHLGPAALGAVTCLLFFNICCQLGVSRRMALWGAAVVAFGSIVAVYSRSPYSEIAQTACFLGFFGRLLLVRKVPTFWGGVALGTWAGMLLNSKLVYGGTLVGAGLLLVATWWRQPRLLLRIVAGAAVGFAPWVLAMLLYNWARWGSVFSIGPRPTGAFVSKTWIGLFGIFLSPGKSVFLYTPALLLTVFALRRALDRHRDLLLTIVATVGPVVYVSASLIFWNGDYAWGPRYVVFATPVLLLPAVLVFDDALKTASGWARRGLRGLLGTALVAGICVQVLGSAFYWDLWIRVGYTAREQWLGRPDLGGSPVMVLGVGCGSCFEQMHSLNWLPEFQPIAGHWWMLKHVARQHDWITAEKDAPWHPAAKVQLDIKNVYPTGRIDWWMFDFAHGHLPAGLGLLAAMCLAGTASFLSLRSALRDDVRARAGPGSVS